MPQEQKKRIRSADAEIDATLSDERIQPFARGEKRPLTQEERDVQAAQTSVLVPPDQTSLLTRLAEDIVSQGGGAAIGGALGGLPGFALGAGAGELLKQGLRQVAGRPDVPQTVRESLTEAGLAAAGGPLQAAGAIPKTTSLLRAGSRITPALTAAQEAGIGITKGQARGGFIQNIESFVARTFGGGAAFQKFGRGQAEELNKAVDSFVSTISRSRLEPKQAGVALQDAIQAARRGAGEQVGASLDTITKELPRLTVPQKGALAQEARDLLFEISRPIAQHPALGKIAGEDINKATAVLREFTKPDVQIPIHDAVKLRSLLFKLTDSPNISTVGAGALKRMNSALHNAIGDAVKGAGRQDLFEAFEAASSNFRTIASNIESRAIQQLVKEDKPELIVDILLRKGGASRTRRVLDIIGEKNFKPIARATIQKMFDDAGSEGILISQSFANIRKKVGDKAFGELLGEPEQIARFDRLSKLIDGLGLSRALTQPAAPSGGLGLIQGGLGGTGLALAAGNIPAAAGAGTFTALLVGVPRVLAEAATRPRFLATIEKELAIAARREGAQGVVKQLAGLVTSQIEQDVARSLLRPSVE